jgi:hypothetical protein
MDGYKHFKPEGEGGQLFESDWFINNDWHKIYKDVIYIYVIIALAIGRYVRHVELTGKRTR